jgi:hypothetical protein
MFMLILIIMDILMARIAGNGSRRRSSRQQSNVISRRLTGRNGESWEGAHYVRPPYWMKNILRKRYLA